MLPAMKGFTHSPRNAIFEQTENHKSDPAECANLVYQHRYNLTPGTTITRTFRGIDNKILVQEDKTFLYNDKIFPTLSAVAKEITGIKISGPDFFGLNKRKKRDR